MVLIVLVMIQQKKIVFDHDAYCVFIYDRIILKIEKKLVICTTSKKKGNIIVDE